MTKKIDIGLRLLPEEYKALKAYAIAQRWSLGQAARILIVDTLTATRKVVEPPKSGKKKQTK